MNKVDNLQQQLSRLIAGVAALGQQEQVIEVKRHLQQAMTSLNKLNEVKDRKSAKSDWWDHVKSGVAYGQHTPMAEHAVARALKALNSMIKEQEDKLSALEKKDKDDGEDILVFG